MLRKDRSLQKQADELKELAVRDKNGFESELTEALEEGVVVEG